MGVSTATVLSRAKGQYDVTIAIYSKFRPSTIWYIMFEFGISKGEGIEEEGESI